MQYASHINTDQTVQLHIILDPVLTVLQSRLGFLCPHTLPCAASSMQIFIGFYVTGNAPSAHSSLEICFVFFSLNLKYLV